MPPRKRQRTAHSPTSSTNTPSRSTPTLLPSASASTPPAVPSSAVKPSTSSLPSPATTSLPHNPTAWTPAQSTDLFKALIRFKPTGLHKHFHMLCVSSFLRSHGHTLLPPSSAAGNTSTAERLVEHTRIPAIWRYLAELYDLDALDEREDLKLFGSGPGVAWEDEEEDSEGEKSEWAMDFGLPGGEDGDGEGDEVFARLMWERRFPAVKERKIRAGRRGSKNDSERGEGLEMRSSSPPAMEWTRDRDGTVVGEKETSPVTDRGRKGKNTPRSTTTKAVASPAASSPAQASKGRGRGRRASKLVEAKAASPEVEEDVEEAEAEDREDSEVKEEEGEAEDDEEASGSGEDEEGEEESGEESGAEDEENVESEAAETSVEVEDAPARGTRSTTVSARGGARGRGRGRGRGRARK